MSLLKLNEIEWPSLDFMVLHELVKLTWNQSKLQTTTEYYDIELFSVSLMSALFFFYKEDLEYKIVELTRALL